MRGCGALAGRISVARVHRRRHQRADGMARILEVAGEVVTTGDGSIIESLPAPVCRRARARRCREVRGRACCGSCAAERETFVWMAVASGLPPGWQSRARSDAARRGARPDARWNGGKGGKGGKGE